MLVEVLDRLGDLLLVRFKLVLKVKQLKLVEILENLTSVLQNVPGLIGVVDVVLAGHRFEDGDLWHPILVSTFPLVDYLLRVVYLHPTIVLAQTGESLLQLDVKVVCLSAIMEQQANGI